MRFQTRLKSLSEQSKLLFEIKKSLNPENLENSEKSGNNPETGWNSGKEDYYISFEK